MVLLYFQYIDIASLLAVVGGNTTDGIDISEFHATTSVVLHELTKRRHRCNTTLSFDSEDYDLNDTRNNLIESWTLDGKLVDEKLQSFLHTSVENKYSGTFCYCLLLKFAMNLCVILR